MGPETLVVGTLPRVSPGRFVAVLREAQSPAAAEAEAGYWAVVQHAVDPLFALAVFRHESQYGRVGICAAYGTKNPGNTRSSRTGVGEVVSTPRGPFVRYPNWTEGFRDLAYRLVDPTFVYAQRQLQTIGEIIPVWAPAADNNRPEAYIASVVKTMETLQQNLLDVPFRVALIPKGNANRPGAPMTPQWITVHETANTNPGANAEAHRRFTHAGGGAERVSFHFVVDDREVIQLLPLTEHGWHAGDGAQGAGNRSSIAIETCVNRDADWEKTLANLVRLLQTLCRMYGWSSERIVQHHFWSGKNCPARIRAEGRWDALLRAVNDGLKPSGPDARFFPETGYWITHGFKAFWEKYGGLMIFGYPLSNEYTTTIDGKPITVQEFERARFEHRPDIGRAEDWHVVLGRVNAERLELVKKLQAAEERAQKAEQELARLRQIMSGVRDGRVS